MVKFRPFILGCVLLSLARISSAAQTYSFAGDMDFAKKKFNVVITLEEGSSVTVVVRQVSEKDYSFVMDVNHLKTPLFDLLSKVESSIEIQPPSEAGGAFPMRGTRLAGKVWSEYSLVDYKPIQELSGSFEIKNGQLALNSLSVGNIQCSGTLDTFAPYKLDLTFHLYDVAMADFLKFWGAGKTYDSSGTVSGEITASGDIGNLVLKGRLESRNGFVQKLDYNLISLNIEGIYPDMKVMRSLLEKSDGVSLTFVGPLDLSDKENFKKQIKALTFSPLVLDSALEREWTIRRLNPDASESTELIYRLQKEDALGTGTSADSGIDMLGIEQTRKF